MNILFAEDAKKIYFFQKDIYIYIHFFCKVILGVFNLECAELAPNPLHFAAGQELSFR